MATIAPSTPFATPQLLDLDDIQVAAIKHTGVRLDDLRELFDAGYPAIGVAIANGSVVPSGPALAIYQGDPMATFELSIGFPIREPLPAPIEVGDLTIENVSIAGGPAAAASYFGSYDGLGGAWAELVDSVVAKAGGLRDGLMIEVYVTMPEPTTPVETLRTDLYALVEPR